MERPLLDGGGAHPAHRGAVGRLDAVDLVLRLAQLIDRDGGFLDRPLDVTGFDVEQAEEFGLDAIVVRYIERYHRELFFRKHSDWSSEHEYRWVLVESGAVAVYVDITDCLTGIVLGDAFPQGRLDTVYELADDWGGIDVAMVKFHNGRLNLLPGPAPPGRAPLAHRRSGSLEERVAALTQAEADAADAHSRGELFAAPGLTASRRPSVKSPPARPPCRAPR